MDSFSCSVSFLLRCPSPLCRRSQGKIARSPVTLPLRCFVLLLVGFLRLIAQLLPLVARHLRDRRDLVLHVAQRVSVSRGVVEDLHGMCSPLTFPAMSRRHPRCATQFTRNIGCALNLVLDPMVLVKSPVFCTVCTVSPVSVKQL